MTVPADRVVGGESPVDLAHHGLAQADEPAPGIELGRRERVRLRGIGEPLRGAGAIRRFI